MLLLAVNPRQIQNEAIDTMPQPPRTDVSDCICLSQTSRDSVVTR